MAEAKPFNVREYDWHDPAYVAEWIARDVTRDEARRPELRRMVALAPFSRDAAIRVLDVGGGYGIVADEVLRAFPKARVGSGSVCLSGASRVPLVHDPHNI